MIDVVFLLVIFFMLTAQFGRESALPLQTNQRGADTYDGPPRLIEIGPEQLRLNGHDIALEALPRALEGLTARRDDLVVLRARGEAGVQRLVTVMQALSAAGFSRLTLAE